MSEYVLFYDTPALVVQRDDGKKYIRLATVRRELTYSEIDKKWRNIGRLSGLSASDFWSAYRYEHVSSEVPLDVMLESEIAKPLPVGWWQARIPTSWWMAGVRKAWGAA